MHDRLRRLMVGVQHLVIHATLRPPVDIVARVCFVGGIPRQRDTIHSGASEAGHEKIGKQKSELQERRLHYS
jgi:hypothetical protein